MIQYNNNNYDDDLVAKEGSGRVGRTGIISSLGGSQATETHAPQPARPTNARNDSSKTILYNPEPYVAKRGGKIRAADVRTFSPAKGRQQRTVGQDVDVAQTQPSMPSRSAFRSAPDRAGTLMFETDHQIQRPTSLAFDLGSDIGDNQAMGGGFVGALPASFTTQMAQATGPTRFGAEAATSNEEYQSMMSKLMLTRMNALEESFREVLKEVRDWRGEQGELRV